MIKRFTFVLFLCLCIAVSAAADVFINTEKPADWEDRELFRLIQANFQSNDAMILQCGGETMLVDGGAEKHWRRLLSYLERNELTDLKYIFNTHPHDDHAGALYQVLKARGVNACAFMSAFPKDLQDEWQMKVVKELDGAGIPYQQVSEGEHITLGNADLVVLRVVSDNVPSSDFNSNSAMLHITFGDSTILLTADVPGRLQREYLERYTGGELKADILKAPHHGINAMVHEFLLEVDPQFAFVTNIRDNVSATRWQLQTRGIPALFTNEGAIIMETDGHDWYITQQKGLFPDPRQ